MYHPDPSIDYCVNRYFEELALLITEKPNSIVYPEARLPFPKLVLEECLRRALIYANLNQLDEIALRIILGASYLMRFIK